MISPFVLHQPNSIEDATSLLGRHGGDAKLLAGGSELILLLKLGLVRSPHVINLKKVAGLSDIEFDQEGQVLRIGALVTHRWIEQSPGGERSSSTPCGYGTDPGQREDSKCGHLDR